MIDFTLTEEQHKLQSAAHEFAHNVLSGARATYSQYSNQFQRFAVTRPIYKKAVLAGIIKAQVPEELGGASGDLVDSAILIEELYAVDPGASVTILGTCLGLMPLIFGGSKEQHDKLLKPFLGEKDEPLASLVHSEPGGTANWLEKGGKGLQTTARKDGDDWIINGEKLWTTNSSGWDKLGANLQCVVCRFSPDGGPQDPDAEPRDNIVILLVTREVVAKNPRDAYQVFDELELAGHNASSSPHTKFVEFRVPAANCLAGPKGNGASLVEQSFGTSAALVGAMAVGVMRTTFEAALDFTKNNTRGGSIPILARQSVADIMINIKMKTESSRYLTWKALHCLQNGPGEFKDRLELALEAKIFCSDVAVECVVDAMKAVGMSSYSKDRPFQQLLNDAICLPIFDGGNIGIRRRQLEKLFLAEDYKPWETSYGLSQAASSSLH
ncbi:MAG: hypothetical protein M1834_009427 [Cirrosporium novae-zelandiae]|nr:MAG: hypothetical protein M1834_009427 [Cirrosporium novae-zelandiae]